MSQTTDIAIARRTTTTRKVTCAAVLGLTGAALLTGPGTAVAVSHPSIAHGNTAQSCAQAKHRFVEARSATVSGKKITVKAHKATFHCGGPDDGNYTVAKAKETLTVTTGAKVKVFKSEDDPSVYKNIKATALPHWLKKNRAEPIYRIAGPKSGITKLIEMFHP